MEQQESNKIRSEPERRMYNFEIRAEQDDTDGAYITGKPIVYNSRTDIGGFDEIIEADALKETDLSDVRFLINHNLNMIPLARSSSGTMKMDVNKSGMDINVGLDVEGNTDAKSLYSAVKRGDISGMSFMFTVASEKWEGEDSEHPIRHILKIGKVYEVSAVTFPAYADTEISARCKEIKDNMNKRSAFHPDEVEILRLKAKIKGGF